jgi:transcription initiation factor IIE alpha subunit
MSVRVEIGKKYVVYMATERHLIIMATELKRAVIDITDVRIVKNTGIPQRTLDRVLRVLADTRTNLFKWLKPVSK